MTPPKVFHHWDSHTPPVLRYFNLNDAEIGHWLPERKIYRLPMYGWHYTAERVERLHREACSLRPQHRLHHLINESDVCGELVARGVPASFVNHNAFLDERQFTVAAGAEKRFDAIYNARMKPFKRHALARGVRRLLIVGGVHAAGDSEHYFEQTRAALPQAVFTHAGDPRKMLAPSEITRLIAQARVGLCLSAVEGAMYAATEYLLCGLPVVSTASLGGRDEWFDTRYVRVVPDDSSAVAAAVDELASRRFDPCWIRQQTLMKMWPHRRRYVDVVQNIFDAELAGREFAREWHERFANKIGEWRPLAA